MKNTPPFFDTQSNGGLKCDFRGTNRTIYQRYTAARWVETEEYKTKHRPTDQHGLLYGAVLRCGNELNF
jgi:hypothetical protein